MHLRHFAILLALAAPALSQDSGFANGESCTVAANVVTCSPTAGTGSLIITADAGDFVKLRNALTPNWDGEMICNACDVASGFPSCTAPGDRVATTRNKAGLARLTCILRSLVKQKDIQDNPPFIPPEPTIGGGDPGS